MIMLLMLQRLEIVQTCVPPSGQRYSPTKFERQQRLNTSPHCFGRTLRGVKGRDCQARLRCCGA